MKVELVPLEYTPAVWPRVERFIQAGLKRSGGEYTAEHLKVYVTSGMQALFVVVEEGELKGAITVNFINYPNDRVAFVTSIGGKMIASEEGWESFMGLLRANGATKCQGAAFESVARLWKQRFGFEQRYVIVEKVL